MKKMITPDDLGIVEVVPIVVQILWLFSLGFDCLFWVKMHFRIVFSSWVTSARLVSLGVYECLPYAKYIEKVNQGGRVRGYCRRWTVGSKIGF